MPVKQVISENLTGQWQIGLFEAPCKAPLEFCFGCCCTCCMAGKQRLDLLDVTGEPYVCCAGMFPCGPLGDPQDRNCAWAEACCCTGCAIAGNRFMIQTRFDRVNTACDECILWVACLAPWVVCILKCFIDVPDEVENLVDCLTMTVNGCMLAQQQKEVDFVKKNGYQGMNPAFMGAMNKAQQHAIGQAGKPQQMEMS
mmetsp:Transcript_70863/g.133945  ORF Transcript_70863/g.133945 Transcript_70863/m.133945 type:complete len:198 (-) Transcript_70863:123-716(-)